MKMNKTIALLSILLFLFGTVTIIGCGNSNSLSKISDTEPVSKTVQTSPATSSQSTLSNDCPGYDFANIPRYSNSTRIEFQPDVGGLSNDLTYSTNDSVQDVSKFFMDQLVSKGWTIVESGTNESIIALMQDGRRACEITISNWNFDTEANAIKIIADKSLPEWSSLKSSDPTLDSANYGQPESTSSSSSDVVGEDPAGLRPPDSVRTLSSSNEYTYESPQPIGFFAAWYSTNGFSITYGGSGGTSGLSEGDTGAQLRKTGASVDIKKGTEGSTITITTQ